MNPAAGAATVRVRLFAGLREAMGWSEQPVNAGPAATPLALWNQLDLGGAWLAAGIRVAINQQFAGADTPLADGDELAFLPPIESARDWCAF